MLIIAAVLDTGVVDIQHNVMQTGVHFARLPAQPRGVLRHFQLRCRHAAALAALPGTKQYARLQGRDRSLQSWLAYLPLPPRLLRHCISTRAASASVRSQSRAWQGDITGTLGAAGLPDRLSQTHGRSQRRDSHGWQFHTDAPASLA